MKTNIAFILFYCLLSSMVAQVPFYAGAYGNVGRVYFANNFNSIQAETKGNPYFNNEEYVKGELQTPDSLYKNDFLYRYDQIVRTLQIKFPDNKEILLDPRDIVYFKLFIEDKEFLFERIKMPYKKDNEILQVIYSSPTMRLLRDSRKKKTRIKDYDPYTSAPSAIYDIIENDYRYHLLFDDMTVMHSVEISKKYLANFIPHKAAFISQLFSSKEFRSDLTVTKLKELMRLLDEEMQRKEK